MEIYLLENYSPWKLISMILHAASFALYLFSKRLWSMTSSLQSGDIYIIYRPEIKWRSDALSQGFSWLVPFKRSLIYWHNNRITPITQLWLSRDLVTIYRPDTKCDPDLVSQVLQSLLSSNFVICAEAFNW